MTALAPSDHPARKGQPSCMSMHAVDVPLYCRPVSERAHLRRLIRTKKTRTSGALLLPSSRTGEALSETPLPQSVVCVLRRPRAGRACRARRRR